MDAAKRGSAALEGRLENVGWGLLFLLVAALALPRGVEQRASIAAVGLLILALNGYRARAGIEVSWFGVALGASCAATGAAAIAGLHPDLLVVFFAVAGLVALAAAVRPSPLRVD
jgi:hypothetical protein